MTITRILAAISVAISAAEYLSIRTQFAGTGIFAADIQMLNWTRGPKFLIAFGRIVFSYSFIITCQAVRLGLGVLLLLPLDMRLHSVILALLFLLQLHSFYFSAVGNDGSDQMVMVVVSALAVAYAFRMNGPCAGVALLFIVAQALLAYATSGIAKLISPMWRSGEALKLILNTACYGSPKVTKWVTRMPSLSFFGSWVVILFECAMPFVVVAPRNAMIGMLVISLLFHLGCAITMGLNCFLWAFASPLPLIYLFSAHRAYGVWGSTTSAENTALLVGGVVALVIVALALIRYYDLFPRLSHSTSTS